jgi:opacity protein-like surface antigen
MKRIVLSVWTAAAMSSLGFAGGDFAPVEPVIETPVVVEESTGSFYVGLGFEALSTGPNSIDFFNNNSNDRTGNLLGLVGYQFNPYIALEGRYATYIFDEDSINSDTWGVYLKPQYPVNEDLKLYVLLGFGGMTVDGVDGANIDVDDSGFQWGLGASHVVAEDIAVFLDYTSIANDMGGTWLGTAADVSSDALTLGVTYSF